MGKKNTGIVDSFIFRRAKQVVDDLTNPDPQSEARSRIISGSYQDHIQTRPGSEQDRNIKPPDKDHVLPKSTPDMQQHKGSGSYQDHITTKQTPQISLSARQSQVYLWFKNHGENGTFNKPAICRDLGIPYISVRKAIQKLQTAHILHLKYDTCQKVYEYTLNDAVQVKLISKRAGYGQDQSRIISGSYQDYITISKSVSNFLHSDPRSLYWKDKGLTEKHLQTWLDETKMSFEDMISSLEHCWFEMVHLGKEEEKGIQDVLSWFYKTVRKVGYYPPPKGFKPYEEIRAEEMARARKRREGAIEKLKEEAQKDYKLKRESE